jgi:hypothetical protein
MFVAGFSCQIYAATYNQCLPVNPNIVEVDYSEQFSLRGAMSASLF